jgi:hypothetical protein
VASDQTKIPANDQQWQKALRGFHLTGHSCEWELLSGQSLWPAAASKLVHDHPLEAYYPLMLPPPGETIAAAAPISLLDALKSLPDDSTNGQANNRDDSHLEKIVNTVASIIADAPSNEIAETVIAATAKLASEDNEQRGAADLQEQLSRLPATGQLVGFGPNTLAELYSWTVAAHQNDRQLRFRKEMEELVVGLEAELVQREQEQNPQSLARTMGEEAALFVDLEKLSRNLPPVGGSSGQLEFRLPLIRETLDILQTFLKSESPAAPFYLISSGEGRNLPEGLAESTMISSNCHDSAWQFVDELLEQRSRVFRAVRTARLLVSGRYQPELHDDVLSRFGWQSCNEDEIHLIPRVLVLDTVAGVKRRGDLASLCRLLRSGRPVQILMIFDESAVAPDELDGTMEDLAAIAIACREAFVFQSTLAQPTQLQAGIHGMVGAARPAIGFVSVHAKSETGDWAWAAELLSQHGRFAPCFRYSPDHGFSQSDRLDISGNPQIEAGLPTLNLACRDLPAEAEKINEAITFAHATAMQPEFRAHFCVIPDDAWNDDQQPIGTYLDEFKLTPPASLPYIWVVNEGQLARAIVTREMANACRDRYLAWRSLQELAGTNERLVSATREEIQRELEAHCKSETEKARAQGREEGTVHAVNRIVEALLGPKA